MFNFVAVDSDGDVYAYENKPFFDTDVWDWEGKAGYKYLYTIANYNPDCASSSLQRVTGVE